MPPWLSRHVPPLCPLPTGFYHNPVEPSVRSLMNVPFTIPSKPDLEKVRLGATGGQEGSLRA